MHFNIEVICIQAADCNGVLTIFLRKVMLFLKRNLVSNETKTPELKVLFISQCGMQRPFQRNNDIRKAYLVHLYIASYKIQPVLIKRSTEILTFCKSNFVLLF